MTRAARDRIATLVRRDDRAPDWEAFCSRQVCAHEWTLPVAPNLAVLISIESVRRGFTEEKGCRMFGIGGDRLKAVLEEMDPFVEYARRLDARDVQPFWNFVLDRFRAVSFVPPRRSMRRWRP